VKDASEVEETGDFEGAGDDEDMGDYEGAGDDEEELGDYEGGGGEQSSENGSMVSDEGSGEDSGSGGGAATGKAERAGGFVPPPPLYPDAAEDASKFAPRVSREMQFDLGNLAVLDPTADFPPDEGAAARAARVLERATACAQAFFARLEAQPDVPGSPDAVTGERCVKLPLGVELIPAAVPRKAPHRESKWKRFAREQGIAKKKTRGGRVFDEASKEWVSRAKVQAMERQRRNRKGPALQEYNADGSLTDLASKKTKHRERYRNSKKRGAVRDARCRARPRPAAPGVRERRGAEGARAARDRYGKAPESRKKVKRQSMRRSKSGR